MSFNPIEERCAPKRVGFASAVENLVAQARAREAASGESESSVDPYDERREEMLEWLEDLGVEARAAVLSLDNYELEVKLKQLRDLVAKYRALWAPEPCPWVGALEDEAKLLARSK